MSQVRTETGLTVVNVYPQQFKVVNYPEATNVAVLDDGDRIVVTSAAAQGPQGPIGPSGPSGPSGPVGVPNFYETSTPPLGATRGDQWIVTTSIGD